MLVLYKHVMSCLLFTLLSQNVIIISYFYFKQGVESMLKKTLIFCFLFWTHSSLIQANETLGFDEICRTYTEATNCSMKKEQLSEYIFINVKERVNVKNALDVHDMIFQLDPKERYKIFKLLTPRDWGLSCC